MIARLKIYLAIAGAAALILAGTNGYTFLRTKSVWYDRGVRDQKILTLGETEILNARIAAAEAEAREAARKAGDAARELLDLQMENARERARDPDAAGSGLPLSELQRLFRVD